MEYLTSPTAQALSWALLHSLWQGVLIMFALMLALRCIPTRYSRVRYSAALTALLGVVTAAAVTFSIRLTTPAPPTPVTQPSLFQLAAYHPTETVTRTATDSAWMDVVSGFVNANVPLVLMLWCIGTLVFSLRITAGWFYINTLRRKADTLDASWQQYIQSLAAQLQVNKLVQVAESGIVQAPVVLGYLKPVVLLPVGMIGGLTTEQIETILIHELVHIRRHDYIINLLQSCVEAIFFFNPCVWFISQQIRNEREHCCDDAVVSVKGSPKHYIHALAMLEEVRLSKAGLALALAENKNVLLNRIKRMMEKTANKHSGRERIVPAVLLIVGLLCASWITIQSPNAEDLTQAIVPVVKADTTIKKKEKSGHYSRTTIITTDENGKSHREVTEEYDGDDAMHRDMDIDLAFEVPEVPEIPPMPDMAGFPDMIALAPIPPMPDIAFAFGPLDTMNVHMNIIAMDAGMGNMMSFNGNMEEWNKAMAKWAATMDSWNAEHGEKMKELQEKMMVWQEENADKLKEIEKNADTYERLAGAYRADADTQKAQADAYEAQAAEHQAHAEAFQQEVRKQLVKDGYLKKNEEITNMYWNDDNMEVNGRKIKSEDYKKKYKVIYEKYFKAGGVMSYTK